MDSSKVSVKNDKNIGKGLFARKAIGKGEIVCDWSQGKVYKARNCNLLSYPQRNRAIEFEEGKWIFYRGLGYYINHSCKPNCGVKGKFHIVAMRDIKKGEHITYDYEMTEDSNWRINCKCGSESCRKVIGAFRNMPKKVRKKYKGYISDWLVNKYKLN